MSPFVFLLLLLCSAAPLLSHAQVVVVDSDGNPVQPFTPYFLQVTHLDNPDVGSNSFVFAAAYNSTTPCPRIAAVDPSGTQRFPVRITNTGSPITLDSRGNLEFLVGNLCVNGPQSPIAVSPTWKSQNGNFFLVAGDTNAVERTFGFIEDRGAGTYQARVCSGSSCVQVGWISESSKFLLVKEGNTFGFKFVRAAGQSSAALVSSY